MEPKDSGFIKINAKQLASLYEPNPNNVDIVERLLENSDYKDANDIISKIKLDIQN